MVVDRSSQTSKGRKFDLERENTLVHIEVNFLSIYGIQPKYEPLTKNISFARMHNHVSPCSVDRSISSYKVSTPHKLDISSSYPGGRDCVPKIASPKAASFKIASSKIALHEIAVCGEL